MIESIGFVDDDETELGPRIVATVNDRSVKKENGKVFFHGVYRFFNVIYIYIYIYI